MDNIYKKINKEEILNYYKNIMPINILKNFENYNDKLTISQVVKFFERHNIIFTKTMIQNYIRVGILPPPINKRYYIKKHLILLFIIYNLKSVYSLDDIKNIFSIIIEDNYFNNIIDINKIYEEFILLYEEYINNWDKNLQNLFNNIEKITNKYNEKNEYKEKISFFFIILNLMVKSIAMKDLVTVIKNIQEEK